MIRFEPPRCPNTACTQHTDPKPRFFRRWGTYQPRCRRSPVPRFCCKSCGRKFSRQTFRHDRGDRRPDANGPLFLLLVSGVGLRQAGRLLKLNVRSVQQKLWKLARTCRALHANLSPRLPTGRAFLLDEEETFEAASIRPLTMPVLIEKATWFVVATAVGSIRRGAVPGSRRRRREEAEARTRGPRPDESERTVREVLQSLAAKVPDGCIALATDEKGTYGPLAREVFGDRLQHETTPSVRRRDCSNPLFAINTTMAMTRDNCGRLRRRSWLVTKKASKLLDHLQLFTVYRNYVRRRFNTDEPQQTPGQLLELVPRNLSDAEVLAWRQDWGDRSIHPMSTTGARTVRDCIAA